MIRQRVKAIHSTGLAILAVGLVAIAALIYSWLDLPGVPADVAKSAESEHVRILTEASDTSPGNDWEDTYTLLSVTSNKNPVAEIEKSLQSAGWTTRRGSKDPLLLSGDTPAKHPKYGVTVQKYENFECLDRPRVCEEFKKAARGQDRSLFVATFMPYA